MAAGVPDVLSGMSTATLTVVGVAGSLIMALSGALVGMEAASKNMNAKRVAVGGIIAITSGVLWHFHGPRFGVLKHASAAAAALGALFCLGAMIRTCLRGRELAWPVARFATACIVFVVLAAVAMNVSLRPPRIDDQIREVKHRIQAVRERVEQHIPGFRKLLVSQAAEVRNEIGQTSASARQSRLKEEIVEIARAMVALGKHGEETRETASQLASVLRRLKRFREAGKSLGSGDERFMEEITRSTTEANAKLLVQLDLSIGAGALEEQEVLSRVEELMISQPPTRQPVRPASEAPKKGPQPSPPQGPTPQPSLPQPERAKIASRPPERLQPPTPQPQPVERGQLPARVYIACDTARAYQQPDTTSASVATLARGTALRVHEQLGDWYAVALPNATRGWIRKGFTSNTPPPSPAPSPPPAQPRPTGAGELPAQVYVSFGVVRAYRQPDTSSASVAVLARGMALSVRAEEHGWYAVRMPSGAPGWVLKSLVAAIPPRPKARPLPAAVQRFPAQVYVSSGHVRAYREPSRRRAIPVSLPRGRALRVRARDGQWYAVYLPDGTLGWVMRALTSTTPPR